MFSLLKPVRFFVMALVRESSPRQMAWGLALGTLVGLVPKGNLIAVVLMLVLCSLRINLGVGLLTAFVVSWVAVLLDPFTHWIGWALLTADQIEPLWAYFNALPLAPWTEFNNTVVLGSLALGLLLVLPLRHYSEPWFSRWTPPIGARLQKLKIVQLLWGAEIGRKLGGV